MQPSTTPQRNSIDVDGVASALRELRPPVAALEQRIRRLSWGLIIGGLVFVTLAIVLLGHSVYIAGRLGEVTAQLDDAARSLATVREEQATTQKTVAAVGEQVEEQARTQPQIQIQDAGAGKKPAAVVVLRPKAPTKSSSDAGTELVLPLQLPPGSRAVSEDAGAP